MRLNGYTGGMKMNELELKYGCNPNQKPSRIFMADGSELPIKVLCGKPGYINFLDAFNGWQLVRELKEATGLPAATSFKHVSPAGAAVGLPLDETMRKIYWVDDMGDLSPLACAYARARGADRMSSFGDFISLSDVCDADTARIIKREVSDGVIAPGYTKEALEILESKKNGKYNVIEIDPDYVPAPVERKQVFGVTFEQGRNNLAINRELLENIVTENKELPDNAKIDMIVSLITLKYTQSNSVCYVKDGQAIGIGAGQQSRVHCTRLAGQKADNWYLRQSPQVLNLQFVDGIKRADRDNAIDVYIGEEYMDVLEEGAWQKIFKVKPPVFTREEKRAWLDGMKGVTIGSDAFFPFGDNIERAHKSGVKYVAQPGGSVKAVHMRELKEDIRAEIILGNTYHLYLRPGTEILQAAGGLHRFNGWDRPILTDSGGFQVFSLTGTGRKITEEGVTFRSHIDGSKHLFTPENVMDIQRQIGADIVMAFDECPPGTSDYNYARHSLGLTQRWLERCVARFDETAPLYGYEQNLFPIVQGCTYRDLREKAAEHAVSLNRAGYAIGGLAVGEPAEEMYAMIEVVNRILPQDKPRYLMGVGTPENILEGIQRGVDMFDCVMPTRNGRNGMIFTTEGTINIKNQKWERDFSSIDPAALSYVDTDYSKAYLRHLIKSDEILGLQICSIHNLSFYLWLVREARKHIQEGDFVAWKTKLLPKITRRL